MDHSSLYGALIEFTEALYRADSVKVAAALFGKLATQFGFDTFACGDYDALDLPRSSYLATAWPTDFKKFYYGEERLEPDPIRWIIPKAFAPITWSDLLAETRTARNMRRGIDASAHFGWRESIVVPIGPIGFRRSIVSLKGARRPLSPHERSLITMAAPPFFERVRSLQPQNIVAHSVVLTNREAQCLAYVARGLSDNDIADTLAVAAATAHLHVENAKRKLGAKTRAHAVALALGRGLIAI
jgi:DNA-binding CsgD family transcriptional regulator